ncbi:MAG: hypothetical protein IPO56_15690 [Flavobacteriales bacterium]|nr:hypothetical protein [Flavobacteriales bacterium]
MQKDRAPLIAWTSITAVGIMAMTYHLRWMPVMRGDTDPALYSRGIGTPLLLWLNGYLGVFLNFQFLSPVGTLSIPLLAYGLFRWKGLVRWQQALLVFTLLSSLVSRVFGGFKSAATRSPSTLLMVPWPLRSEHCGREDTRLLFASLALLSLLNVMLSLVHRQRTWRADPTYNSPDTKPDGSLSERLDSSPRDLEGFLRDNGVAQTDTVLVNNLPIWYYVTDRPGVYFWSGSDQLFLADSKPFLFKDRTDDEVMAYMRDSLHCRYLFSTIDYDTYNPRYISFVQSHMDLLATDDRDHTLYRLKDTFDR